MKSVDILMMALIAVLVCGCGLLMLPNCGCERFVVGAPRVGTAETSQAEDLDNVMSKECAGGPHGAPPMDECLLCGISHLGTLVFEDITEWCNGEIIRTSK